MSDSLDHDDPPAVPVSLLQQLEKCRAVEKAAKVLIDGLDAKTPNGMPDYRSRKEAAIAILDRVEGKPIERQQIVKVTKSDSPPMEEILRSPAASAALAKSFMGNPAGRAAIEAQRRVLEA